MDLKQLKTFICVAESGSLSRASDRLHIVQPALSRQIKLLEHEIGIELFTRHVRGMELTDAGKEFLERVGGLVRQLEVSIHDVQSMRGEIKGDVAVGLMPTISTVLSVRLVQRVTEELPGVRLRVAEGYSVHLLEWLQRGDIDVSFLYGSATDYHLRGENLLYEDIVLIGAPGSAADQQEAIALEEAVQLSLALPSELFGLRRVLDSYSKSGGIVLEPHYEIDSFWVIQSLVKRGIAYSLMPISSVRQEVEAGLIVTRPLIPEIQRKVMLAMPHDRSNTRATKAVIQVLKAEVAAMVSCGEWPAQLC
ncbi:MAG: LysR family transcriptional regulator [Thiolinea sp.]